MGRRRCKPHAGSVFGLEIKVAVELRLDAIIRLHGVIHTPSGVSSISALKKAAAKNHLYFKHRYSTSYDPGASSLSNFRLIPSTT